MAAVSQDAYALRNTLLIAGLYYAWKAGDMYTYESTFLFHKIEAMGLVNKWLSRPDSGTLNVCIRQISTLCFAEVS